LLGPEYLLLDEEENLYAVDSGNHRINKYKKNGDILFSFGTEKSGDGKLLKPAGLLNYDNKIYVCDTDANRVVIFDKSGNYISSFGEDKLDKPYDITIDKYNRFLII
jgi:DNA-binding beta-propeller fold protein YncE